MSKDLITCHKCKKVLLGNEPQGIVRNQKYCADCFKCNKCQKDLGGTVNIDKDGNFYCSTSCQYDDMLKEMNKCVGGCGKTEPKHEIEKNGNIITHPDYTCEECNKKKWNELSGRKCKKCNKKLTYKELNVVINRYADNPEQFDEKNITCGPCFTNKDQERERERETNLYYLASMTRNPLTKATNLIQMKSVKSAVLLA